VRRIRAIGGRGWRDLLGKGDDWIGWITRRSRKRDRRGRVFLETVGVVILMIQGKAHLVMMAMEIILEVVPRAEVILEGTTQRGTTVAAVEGAMPHNRPLPIGE
jgi:hypothetical protein